MEIITDGNVVNLTLGADPEVFASRLGKLFSAHGLVQGTKENPFPVDKGAIQVDGMALEFNIDPSNSCDEFVTNILTVMKELKKRLPVDVTLAVVPTAEFGKEYIDTQPEIAKELGCSADLNAYTGLANTKPNADVPFRTAAGHVHIGWTEHQDIHDEGHFALCCDLTQVLDLYLGVPSVLLDPDTKRRSLYGAAGAFRCKEYGLEYRVLSNFWLKSKATIEWVYKQVIAAVKAFLEGFRVSDVSAAAIQQAINASNQAMSRGLMEASGLKEFDHGL